MGGTRILWLLMLLSPAMGELLSGSCPPLQFFNPLTFVVLVLFYGGGAVLIRELRIRWSLQWPVIFLAVSYAIWEECTTVQSVFNPRNPTLNVLGGYGYYGGVQWPWLLDMVYFHSTMSILLPIVMVDLYRPEMKDTRLLGRRGLILIGLGILFARTSIVGYMLTQEAGKEHPYRPNAGLILGSVVVVGLLIWLAYRFRSSVITAEKPPLLPLLAFAAAGFLSQAANLLVPIAMAASKFPAPVTLAVQLSGMAIALAFAFTQLVHRDRATRHLVALVIGSLSFYLAFSPLLEFGPAKKTGMTAVGILALILLVFLARRARKAAIDVNGVSSLKMEHLPPTRIRTPDSSCDHVWVDQDEILNYDPKLLRCTKCGGTTWG